MSLPQPPVLPAAPYPGLRPFRRDEAAIFFGREEQVDQLLEKLGQHRLVVVSGPSGCGKSSLVRTGLTAALETGFLAEVGARWRIAEMRPGTAPLDNLASALQESTLGGPGESEGFHALAFLRAALRRGPAGLLEVL